MGRSCASGGTLRDSMRKILVLGLIAPLAAGCGNVDLGLNVPALEYDMASTASAWTAIYADTAAIHTENDLEWGFGRADLPGNLAGEGFRLRGKNLSDDMFMAVFRQVDGLEPGMRYTADFTVTFATNALDDQPGAGGSPGSAVGLKAGFADIQPLRVLQGSHYRMNIDHGVQSNSGRDMKLIDTIGLDGEVQRWDLKTVRGSHAFTARQDGRAWLVVGTDSGFEGTTEIFLTRVQVRLRASRT